MFSPELLDKSNYVTPTKVNKINNPLDESYFSIAVKVIEEMSNIAYDNESALYRSVLEAGENTYLINESFSDFKESVKKIIDKFLALIKSLFARFVTAMSSIVQSDKHLKKHKADIMKFSTEHEFDMSVFNFTNIEDATFPQTSAYAEVARDFNLPSITPSGDAITRDQLTSTIKTIYTNKKDSMKNFYEQFRAKVLGREGNKYDSGEYSQELFEFFRGGEKDKADTKIDREWVVNAYQRFNDYEKTLKDTKTIQNNLEKEYNNIKKAIKNSEVQDDNMLSLLYDPSTTDNYEKMTNAYREGKKDIDVHVDLIEKLKIQRIEEMCKIHSLAFAAKLDAIKDCYKQDKKVLYKALGKVQKDKSLYESAAEVPVEEATEIIDESVFGAEQYDNAYTNYLITEAVNQQKIIRNIIEADCLSNGMIPIQESVIDVLKAGVQKVIAAIKKTFAKFIGKVKEFVQTDKAWLADNKKTILNQPWKDREVTAYNYANTETYLSGEQFKLPNFIFEEFKEIALAENVEDAFILKYFKSQLKTGEDIKEQLIDIMRGEQQDMSITHFDKKQMYTFCINYESIAANLEKDLTKIDENKSIFNQEIGKLENEITKQQQDEERAKAATDINNSKLDQTAQKAEKDAQQAEKDANDAETKADQNNTQQTAKIGGKTVNVKDSAYVSLYGTVISEGDGLSIGKIKDEGNKTGTGTAGAKSARIDTGANKMTDEEKKKIQPGATSSDDYEGKLKELDSLKTGAPKFFTAEASIILAKFVVCQKVYKDYMKLLHAHVESYTGTTEEKK